MKVLCFSPVAISLASMLCWIQRGCTAHVRVDKAAPVTKPKPIVPTPHRWTCVWGGVWGGVLPTHAISPGTRSRLCRQTDRHKDSKPEGSRRSRNRNLNRKLDSCHGSCAVNRVQEPGPACVQAGTSHHTNISVPSIRLSAHAVCNLQLLYGVPRAGRVKP